MPYRCRTCRRHFSAMSHTVMHASKLGAQTWLLALFLILSNPKGRSSVQLAADLGISQKSALHVGHRLREALADGSLPGFEGLVEADEIYVGGKARNWHAKRRFEMGVKPGRSTAHKTAVAGSLRPVGRIRVRSRTDYCDLVTDSVLRGNSPRSEPLQSDYLRC